MRRISSALLAGAAIVAGSSATFAGGFQRGVADTDILFERVPSATRFGVTYVDPQRGFSSVNGVDNDNGDYTGDYLVPTVAIYFGGDAFGCAGHYTESFAAEADYTDTDDGALPRQVSSTLDGSDISDPLDFGNANTTSRTRSIEFASDELGATCRASYTSGENRFSLLGGVFFEDFDFEGSSLGFRNLNPIVAASAGALPPALLPQLGAFLGSGAQFTLPTQIDVDSDGDYKAGFRIGAAYERPEIALRVQAIYRSEIEHDDIEGSGTVEITDAAFVTLPDGTTQSIPTVFGPAGPLVGGAIAQGLAARGLGVGSRIDVDSSLNEATSPQYVSLTAQTGIAQGTLLLGSFRWTDWSTNNEVISTISSPLLGTSSAIQPYQWRDGYTVSLGLGRAFNEKVSGLVSLGYDRGTSTGADTTYTDLYTVSGGIAFKPVEQAELRLGGLLGYWTDGAQRIEDGAYFDGDVGDDLVYAVNGSLKFTF